MSLEIWTPRLWMTAWQGILLGGALRSQRADVRLECKYAKSDWYRWLTLAAEKHSSLHSDHLHTDPYLPWNYM